MFRFAGQRGFQEVSNLEEISNLGVFVDGGSHVGDELDYPLRLDVRGERLASKNTNTRDVLFFSFLRRHLLHLLIAVDDTQDVQQLAFVLVNAFHLAQGRHLNNHIIADKMRSSRCLGERNESTLYRLIYRES